MITLKEQRERYEMYLSGATDQEIAEKLGYAPETIQNWRAARNLPSNYGLAIEIEDKYITNKYRYKNRVQFAKDCIKNASSILKCNSTFEEKEKFPFVSFSNGNVVEDILLLNMKDDKYFTTDKDFERYVNSRIKSLMCKFIRSLYDEKGKEYGT